MTECITTTAMIERMAIVQANADALMVLDVPPITTLADFRYGPERDLYLANARAVFNAVTELHPASDWHEDMGPCLWWRFPIKEPPYVGSPLDCGYANGIGGYVGGWPGYHTHFARIPVPAAPKES